MTQGVPTNSFTLELYKKNLELILHYTSLKDNNCRWNEDYERRWLFKVQVHDLRVLILDTSFSNIGMKMWYDVRCLVIKALWDFSKLAMKFQLNRFMVKLKSLKVWELDIDCGSSLMLELKKKVKGLMLQT